jgi:Zinc finger, C2H2 type
MKHTKRFCKFQKPTKSTEELEKIAEIAKAQFESIRKRKSRDQNSKMDQIMSEIVKREIETSAKVEIEDKTVDECWIYEYLDEADPTNLEVHTIKLEEKATKPRKVYNDGRPRKTNLIPRCDRTLQPDELYTCDFCGKGFSVWISIYTHVTTVHKHVGDFKCEKCARIFTTAGNLKRHVESSASFAGST